jgi:NAD(P)-dependent dehydrogenase (short-subunit alcohol dehydrogenase family)
MRIDLAGTNALVTGGSSGIGLAIARLLRDSGASVWIADLKPSPEPGFHYQHCDVADPSSVARAVDAAAPLGICVANAGTGSQADLASTSLDLWQRTLSINLSGVFHTVQAAARAMKPLRRGAIVLTASTNSYDGEPNLTAYNATKAGVLGILHTAANELGPYGIRVNAVCPGLIRTPLTLGHFDSPALLKEYFRHVPLGRGGEPEEVASAAVFLASPLASYITGAALLVDGGQMATKFGTWHEETARFENGRWILNPEQ